MHFFASFCFNFFLTFEEEKKKKKTQNRSYSNRLEQGLLMMLGKGDTESESESGHPTITGVVGGA